MTEIPVRLLALARALLASAVLLSLGTCSGGGGEPTDVDPHAEIHEHNCSSQSQDVPASEETMPPLIQGFAVRIALDSQGNRYVTGDFCAPRDFNPSAGVDTLTSRANDAFVTRFNADLGYGWTQTFGGGNADGGIDVAEVGNTLYVVGEFSSIDAGVGGAGDFASAGDFDVFILALDSRSGRPRTGFGRGGVQTFGGGGNDLVEDVVVAGHLLLVTGYFTSIDAGIGGLGNSRAVGNADGFVLALDRETGQPITNFGLDGVQTFGGTFNDESFAVAVSGNTVYAGGIFWSSNFGIGGPGTLAPLNLYDGMIVALDLDTGAPVPGFGRGGVQTFGGSNEDLVEALQPFGSTLIVSGRFGSFDAGVGGFGPFAPATDQHDTFVMALDPASGALATSFAGTGLTRFGGFGVSAPGFDFEGTTSMALLGNTLFVGGFFRSLDAGVNGAGNLTTQGFTDAFVWALDAPTGNTVTSFGVDGVQTFGGPQDDIAYGVAAFGQVVTICGSVTSTQPLTPDCGPFDANDWRGFMLDLFVADGLPVCQSAYPN